MEFQEAMVRVHIQPNPQQVSSPVPMKDHVVKHKWKFSFPRRSSPSKTTTTIAVPKEFICPVSGNLMNDPVIVKSGHTFECVCVQACTMLGFVPSMEDGRVPDFCAIIPNLALKSAIRNWCNRNKVLPPKPLDFLTAENIVRSKMAAVHNQQQENMKPNGNEAAFDIDFLSAENIVSPKKAAVHTPNQENMKPNGDGVVMDENVARSSTDTVIPELNRRKKLSTSDDLTSMSASPSGLKKDLSARSSFSSSSFASSTFSLSLETLTPDQIMSSNSDEEEILKKLNSEDISQKEAAVISLRTITKDIKSKRLDLCTPSLLEKLRSLCTYKYENLQVNAVACIYNLSVEKPNRETIIRNGIVPSLINVLTEGCNEAHEHACRAFHSLSFNDKYSQVAIGVLGALEPLLNMLRSSQNHQTRLEAASALSHLSKVQSNKTKLIKFGAVPLILNMIKSDQMISRALVVLRHLALSPDGTTALLDSDGVECLVALLKSSYATDEVSAESQRSCIYVLYMLSRCEWRFRFKSTAKAAGAVDVLIAAQKFVESESLRNKLFFIASVITKEDKTQNNEDDHPDWEGLLYSETDSTESDQFPVEPAEQ